MMDFDEPRAAKPHITLGEDLSVHSVEELQDRISALKAEIARVESQLAKKMSTRSAAETIFKR